MKPILWSAEKNALLRAERGVSFGDVVFHIVSGDVLNTFDHSNQERYRGQQIHIIAIEDYVSLVPFVESEEEVCLKTMALRRRV